MQQCCICLTNPTDGRLCQLHCSHVFHAGCIDTWLSDNNTCPTCRKVVDPQRVLPPREDSFPRNMNEFAAMLFGFPGFPFYGIRAEPAPPPPPDRPPQPTAVDEDRRRASVETITSYLRLHSHTTASSAVPLERLANLREIWGSLPPTMSLSQLVNSQRDVFHVIRQGSASAVYVDPQPSPSSDSSLSQCVSAISSYLVSRGHTSQHSSLPLSVLCDVPAVMRTLPSNLTISAVISSSSAFVLLQQSNGAAAVFCRASPRTMTHPCDPVVPGNVNTAIASSANSSSIHSAAVIRTPESYNHLWETFAVAAYRHLQDFGFTSSETSLSIRQLGTVEHLRSLRAHSFPPLVQLLRHYPHLIAFKNEGGLPRVWAVTGFSCQFKHPVFCSHVHRRLCVF